MGRDKALLELPGTNLLLWQRQWQLLEGLRPVEMLWSGPPRPHLPDRAIVVPDRIKSVGPLGGLSACLDALQTDLLVLLAVDLPRMNLAFLEGLLAPCTQERGMVARHGDFFEPMAAVYPKRLHLLAAEYLAEGRHVMQDFIREAVQQEALATVQLEERDRALFKNLNSPSDLTEA